MENTPKFDWIRQGKKIESDKGVFYEFQAPFTEVGEPYGDFLRSFFNEWKKDLIPPPTQKSECESIYAENKQYLHYFPIFDDTLHFGFNIDLQGKITGLAMLSHHSRPISVLDNFLTKIGELMSDIKSISIMNDFLELIPSSWQKLTQLEFLYIKSPQFNQISYDLVENWRNLHEIHICCAPLESFPVTLCYFPGLTDLIFEACPNIRTLPPEIGQLRNLKRLEIINCSQFTHLPPEIGKLINLWGLDLVDLPHFAALPSEIGSLTDLRVIILSQLFQLHSIPPEIGHCAQLRALRIDHLPLLRTLPEELGQCHMLNELKIDRSVFLDALPLSLVQTALMNGHNIYKYFHDKVIVPTGIEKKISVYDQRFLLIDDPIESLDEWIRIRGELGLDVESAQAFKTWFIKNIPPRAYPWFTGFGGGHQPTRYEDIQWLLSHPQFFQDNILEWIDQQVAEWTDHDRVNTTTREDWERLKHQAKKK